MAYEAVNQERERFYQARDRRTIQYLDGEHSPYLVPVSVHAGWDVCCTRAGQLLLVSMANQMARVHRHLRFSLADPDSPLQTHSLCNRQTLGGEIEAICKRIDPYGSFVVDGPSSVFSQVAIGVGEDCPPQLAWYLGYDRSIARLARRRCRLGRSGTADLRGAALAAIIGAATAFKAAIRMETVPVSVSSWNLKTGIDADPGPSAIPMVDVGRALMVGVGAVGSAAMYWLANWGNASAWTVVDADVVTLDNTNRCLLFFPDDAGWPDGVPARKVTCAAKRVPNVTAVRQWYDQAPAPPHPFDTVVVLANERDVRTRISVRNDPIQFQATTGRSWMSQLHRHIVGRDDCVRCRMDDIRDPQMTCGEAPIDGAEDSAGPDAALPFLSAASGLMLVSALQRLQGGDFGQSRLNTWRWDFRSTYEVATSGQHLCQRGCSTLLPRDVRNQINSATRWADAVWLPR